MESEMLECSGAGIDSKMERGGALECINLIVFHRLPIDCDSLLMDSEMVDRRIFCPLPDGVNAEMETVRLLTHYREVIENIEKGTMQLAFTHDSWIETSTGWTKQRWSCIVTARSDRRGLFFEEKGESCQPGI